DGIRALHVTGVQTCALPISVSAAVLIGAATRVPGLVSTLFAAMPQEHERSLGLWHAEWETLPEICCLVSGALAQALIVVPGLEVDRKSVVEGKAGAHRPRTR